MWLGWKRTYFPKTKQKQTDETPNSLIANYSTETLWQISVPHGILPIASPQSSLTTWTCGGQVGVGLRITYLKSKLRRSKQRSSAQRNWQRLLHEEAARKKDMKCIKTLHSSFRALIKYKMSLTPLLFLQTPAIQEFYYSGANVF